MSNQKYIVFAVEHYNTLGLVRSLGEKGMNPIYIGIKGKAKLAGSSRYVAKTHYVDTQEEGYNLLLSEYGNEEQKPYVLCIDDKTVSYMDDRYDELKDKFIFFNAGAPGRVNEYMDKLNILQMAEKHGLKTLRAYRCNRSEIPAEIKYPVITKSSSPTIGGWKSDVHVCNSPEELAKAYEQIDAPTVLVQEYIEKKNEYCIEGFSVNNGKDSFFSIASTYNYLLPNYYSPYMTVRNMDNEYVRKALSEVLADIGFEGIFEIEFLIDQDDTLYFGEINFRNSTWSYASTVAGMNLPYLWVRGMEEGKVPADAYKKIEEPFTGMVEPIDYGKRVDTGKIDVAEWLGDFKDAKCLYYYNEDDREPFYELMRNWDKLK
jgi:D-aspartate ligase